MSEDFSGGAVIRRIVDIQYERERRTPRPRPSPRYNNTPEDLRRTLLSVGFDAPLASEIAREFIDLEDDGA